ncbi:hypothetical protein H6P81_017273 [Aristolochia fimbriata]|uniref:Leucine-rich repeat-containing N-terminal plant-type domain-containing protein n=1 Tax=Aristolochia fimbriata TaxID=158543 RepID=A0AAV7DYQ1_ARIFI|nr:hypothetical protein H6P81_017273 [Aristolochia fimbriata]
MIITNKALVLSLLYYYMLLIMKIFLCIGCLDSEREAVTQFKQGLIDPSHRLASWNHGLDCCTWDGVSCDNETGYVIQLDLHNPYSYNDLVSYSPHPERNLSLGGRVLDPALEQLKHLQHLDLSGNSFDVIQIPNFLGSFQWLRYLNLSFTGFGGRVPQYIGNLSTLEVLDLSSTDEYYLAKLKVGNLEWLAKDAVPETPEDEQGEYDKSKSKLGSIDYGVPSIPHRVKLVKL